MNSNKLNNIIKKKSKGNNNLAHHLHQMFFFEHVLMRLEKSIYRDNIILKGGVLLSSIIGENLRTTKDIDATLKSLPLNMDTIKNIFEEIFDLNIDDNVNFEIVSIKDIRLEDQYGGYRLNILSKLDNNKTYITIELTTGDEITPREMKYSYNCIFEDKKIPIMAYTIETVLAEKFQTIISRGILNTRLKDFYDMYVLMNLKSSDIDNKISVSAIANTFKKRETLLDINEFNIIIDDLENDRNIKRQWLEYQAKNSYAKDINYEDTINSIKILIELLEKELTVV